ncbi:N-acetylglucosamine-1-phosphotransferase subunits alpha/beta [Hondaea fermentalgiana]|uniref:N-acetylglucosamine-1-phosphotransferase subunits alpha/beta n=1 Tax=Hondaea fermentalgiana TaxID=2315210 RepID=A0A2R5GNU7_9STRA|nr:N-acetylglucosamine-1-phosphotransferase subunits alpha/beta [Hondaea fermentalgiana]|eukprot:GBG32295.1 N-acetylglucosamine-1-phosphotransferase subunits alpha/beta [Hondaea fermentalgiana]
MARSSQGRAEALVHNVLKGTEKILLDTINGLRPVRNQGWCIMALVVQAVLVSLVCLFWLYRVTYASTTSHHGIFGCEASSDNLAGKSFPELACAAPVDVVYTWVNGSDPRWLEQLRYYREQQRLQDEAREETSPNDAESIDETVTNESGEDLGAATSSLQNLHEQIEDLDEAIRKVQQEQAHPEMDSHAHETRATQTADFEASSNLRPSRSAQIGDHNDEGHLKQRLLLDEDSVAKGQFRRGLRYGESYDGDFGAWDRDADAYLQASLDYDELLQREYIAVAAKEREGSAISEYDDDGTDQANGGDFFSEDKQEPSIEEASSANRFRDNEELRFSLRSLEKYAPWVRHIYIVTDNQIPSWLDLNHPRMTLVSHADIFANKSHLPTFSSPSIEANLHRIPGLGENFIYFNDDVMLGAPVWPSDFHDPALGQRIFLAWALPHCSDGCISNWIGDNYCDAACNVAACDFDGGDCEGENAQMPNWGDPDMHAFGGMGAEFGEFDNSQAYREECSDGCRKEYLADGFCDRECAHPECGWDGVDCFEPSGPPARAMPFVFVDPFPLAMNKVTPLALPFGVRAASLNLSHIENEPELTIETATATSASIVTKATFHQPTKTLNLVFANPGAPTEHHLVWGGTSLETFAFGENVTTFFSEVKRDQYLVGGCAPGLGCEQFESLELAMQMCLVRGSLCGGVTSSNRHAPPATYELRAGSGLAPSYTYEDSWQRSGDFDGACAESSADLSVDVEKVAVHLKMSDESAYLINITSSLPLCAFGAATSERSSSQRRGLASSLPRPEERRVTTHAAQSPANLTFAAAQYVKQARLKRQMLLRVNAFRAHIDDSLQSRAAWRPDPESDRANASTSSASTLDAFMSEMSNASEAVSAAPEASAVDALPSRERRTLIDTFGGSLLHVNKLYTEVFGKRERRVIAHMPHFMQKTQIEAMQARFAEEFARTSQNRFRSTDDMQFAFAYMYWIVHQGDQPLFPPREYFDKELDTDGDGVLSPNELITLAAMQVGGDAGHHSTRETLLAMVRCVDPTILGPPHDASSSADEDSEGADDDEELQEEAIEDNKDDLVRFTFEQIMACELTRGALLDKTPRKQTHSIIKEEDSPVAFQMLGDDFVDVASQLDSIRARKPKFICVNDNMDHPSMEVLQELRNFQLALFPQKSSFELPLNRRNRFLYMDEYHSHLFYYNLYARATYALIILVICVYFCPCFEEVPAQNADSAQRRDENDVRADVEGDPEMVASSKEQ